MIRTYHGACAEDFVKCRRQIDRSKDEIVARIIDDVRSRGDLALREYAERYDHLQGKSLSVDSTEIDQARRAVSKEYVAALRTAQRNIRRFAQWQKAKQWQRFVQPGVAVGQAVRPIERVGCYVPGGAYPLPSTLLMTVVPARVAGVPHLVVTSPRPAVETLAAASLAGIKLFYRIGGAHAIAALAFGTDSMSKVDKIVGPGNAYVASAKRLLAGEVAIDSVAGPSEVVIVGDEGKADWIAADLLAQAEHDSDASAIFITWNRTLSEKVKASLEKQIMTLPTAETARRSLLLNGAILLCSSAAQAMEWANMLAPEHLCLLDPALLTDVQNAGSVFLGAMSTESLGDYASGPNHVLPTNGHARARGGLSVNDFIKIVTYQQVSQEGLRDLAPTVTTLARAEGLEGHARAVEVRL